MIRVILVDDHVLLRHALASRINEFDTIKVAEQCNNGKELIQFLEKNPAPDLILLDLNMKVMNGMETALWLKDNRPEIKVLMLTMYDSELTLIQLLQAGVKGIIHKSAGSADLRSAIMTVVAEGQYFSNHTTSKLVNLVKHKSAGTKSLEKALLNDEEISFLKLACSDMTYKEVAQKMKLNPRAVDALRDQLFVKLDVKSRVGLAMVALRHGIVNF
jgi:two-component system invasion response regulator UvrY